MKRYGREGGIFTLNNYILCIARVYRLALLSYKILERNSTFFNPTRESQIPDKALNGLRGLDVTSIHVMPLDLFPPVMRK